MLLGFLLFKAFTITTYIRMSGNLKYNLISFSNTSSLLDQPILSDFINTKKVQDQPENSDLPTLRIGLWPSDACMDALVNPGSYTVAVTAEQRVPRSNYNFF